MNNIINCSIKLERCSLGGNDIEITFDTKNETVLVGLFANGKIVCGMPIDGQEFEFENIIPANIYNVMSYITTKYPRFAKGNEDYIMKVLTNCTTCTTFRDLQYNIQSIEMINERHFIINGDYYNAMVFSYILKEIPIYDCTDSYVIEWKTVNAPILSAMGVTVSGNMMPYDFMEQEEFLKNLNYTRKAFNYINLLIEILQECIGVKIEKDFV